MASYDQPGWTDHYPGGDGPKGTGAPGTVSQGYQAADSIPDSLTVGTIGPRAVITPAYSSLANAIVVNVGLQDTLSGPQADLYSGQNGDRLTGIPGDQLGHSGAGDGSISHPGNPNAMTVGSLAEQINAARTHS